MWTDKEIDLIVQALIDPPPYGFTEYEKKEFLDYLKRPSIFDQRPVMYKGAAIRSFFNYVKDEA